MKRIKTKQLGKYTSKLYPLLRMEKDVPIYGVCFDSTLSSMCCKDIDRQTECKHYLATSKKEIERCLKH